MSMIEIREKIVFEMLPPFGWSIVVSKYQHVFGFDIGFGWGFGVFAQIVALLLFMGVISVTDAQVIEKIVAIAFMVYGAFPIANDPTSRNKF